MPNPKAGENKEHYIKRCIPQLMDEGKPQKQAIAICYSMWERKNESKIVEKINIYLEEEQDIKKVKKELAFLRQSEKNKKITERGKKRKEHLENFLFSKGIFD